MFLLPLLEQLVLTMHASRSAAELDELFERKIKPYRFHKTITATQRVAEAEHIIKL